MPIMTATCPRCDSKNMTFDVKSCNARGIYYRHQHKYELFAVCKGCKQATIFVAEEGAYPEENFHHNPENIMKVEDSLNNFFTIDKFINVRDNMNHYTPEFIPDNIKEIFEEGDACLSIGCWNAAGAMFRLCVDLTTKDMISKETEEDIPQDVINKLAPRIDWLFAKDKIPSDLKDIASIIRQDGNDGVHDGTLERIDAINMLEFTTELLEDIYTRKAKKENANKRTKERRAKRDKK